MQISRVRATPRGQPLLAKAEALTVLAAMGAKQTGQIEPCLNTIARGMPIKKLVLVAEMSMDGQRNIDPERFATTMQSAGLLDP